MRSHLLPIAVILSMTGASLAMASTTTAGAIKAMDMKAMTVTLADGTTYKLPAGFKDPGLKVGEKISIVWDLKDKVNEASAVTVVK